MAMFHLSPHINDLPPEMLLHIMEQLPRDDVCKAYQVCTKWQAIAEHKSLWKDYDLDMKLEQEEDTKIFSTHPYKNVLSICVRVTADVVLTNILAPKLFSALLANQIEMKRIGFIGTNADFTAVTVENLVQVANNVEDLEFKDIKLSDVQLNSLFTALGQESSSLSSLALSHMDLTGIDVNKIANICHLKDLYLPQTKLTDDQVKSIFYGLETESSMIQSLCLSGINLTSVNSTSLANGCKRICSIEFEDSIMSRGQFKTLISTLVTSDNVEVTYLVLSFVKSIEGESSMKDLSIADVDLIVTLAEKMTEQLKVDLCEMGDSKFAHFISALSKKSLRNLTYLDLSSCDFSVVNIKELSQLLSKLSYVRMVANWRGRRLSKSQCADLFSYLAKKMVLKQCSLVRMDLWGNNLSRVATDDLIRVVTNLIYVNLTRTKISGKKSRALFTGILNESDVKVKRIEANVPKGVPKVLLEAVKNKKNVEFLFPNN